MDDPPHHEDNPEALAVWKTGQCDAIREAIDFDKNIIRDDTGINKKSHQDKHKEWSCIIIQHTIYNTDLIDGILTLRVNISGRPRPMPRIYSAAVARVRKHYVKPSLRKRAAPATLLSPSQAPLLASKKKRLEWMCAAGARKPERPFWKPKTRHAKKRPTASNLLQGGLR